MVQDLTQDTFDQSVNSGLAVVDFWAPWCAPCKRMAPMFDETANERSDVTFGKVNVEDQGQLAQRFNVMSMPTIVFLKDGRVVDQHVGELRKADLLNKLNSLS